MARQPPIKGYMLKRLRDDGPAWDYDLINFTMKEYGCESEYWKYVIRFNLMEMAGGGLLDTLEEALDDGSHFSKDAILVKYSISDFGTMRVETLLE